MKKMQSVHSKVVVQLDEAAHKALAKAADANDRTIRDQARYLIKVGLGLLPTSPASEGDRS